MDFKKHALIMAVIESLRKHGSWTGKTHLQKALFLLSAAHPKYVPFQFVLYKHGPYSFDVEPELEEMKSYAAVVAEPVPGYGVVLKPGSMAGFPARKAPLRPRILQAVDDICRFVNTKKVTELEPIATAAWIRVREKISDPKMVAERLHALKPHIQVADALRADETLSALRLHGVRSQRLA
jgi:hypothetical protein